MSNINSLVPFQKGDDPRRNTKGSKPKTIKQLRALIVSVSAEPVKEGAATTRIENRIRKALKSENPTDLAIILKYGWGNVPDEIENKNSGTIKLVVQYANTDDKDNPS